MPYRVSDTALNASTLDILNVIRSNASYEYQSLVPEVETSVDIPRVGEVLYGHPALANQFINALVNRIALVRAKAATFNNPYAELKKGYLNFGETVEEVFVEIAKPVEFAADKAVERELRRTLPDVRAAFHVMNWRVMYPVTIQDEELRMAFTSVDGVRDLIAKIVDSIYTAAEYDEFLLFKYMLIKSVNSSAIKPIYLGANPTDKAIAVAARAASNKFQFLSPNFNAKAVHTNTKREDQYIFMDADYNAQFDVEVLASAFNMDKATFIGHLKLIDDWTTFDSERWAAIRAQSTMVDEISDDELAAMGAVKAILVDKEFFQIYDNTNKFTEKYLASGLYWNYFYHVWKTVSWSPFSNAVVFMGAVAPVQPINLDFDVEMTTIITKDGAVANCITLTNRMYDNITFKLLEANASAGIAVTPNGVITYNAEDSHFANTTIECSLPGVGNYGQSLEHIIDAAGGYISFSRAD